MKNLNLSNIPKFFLVGMLTCVNSPLFADISNKYFEAISDYHSGNFNSAASILGNLGEKLEQYPNGYYILGRIYWKEKNPNLKLAEKYFKKFLEISSAQSERKVATINLIYVLNEEGNTENAKSTIDTLYMKDDYRSDGDVRYCYAIVYNSIGYAKAKEGSLSGLEESLAYFRESIDKWPKSFESHNNLIYALMGIIDKIGDPSGSYCKEVESQLNIIERMVNSLKRRGEGGNYNSKYRNTKKRVEESICK